MPNPYYQDGDPAFLDMTDEAVVAHAVLPEAPQLGAFQGFAEAARIIERGNTFPQKPKDLAGYLSVEL